MRLDIWIATSRHIWWQWMISLSPKVGITKVGSFNFVSNLDKMNLWMDLMSTRMITVQPEMVPHSFMVEFKLLPKICWKEIFNMPSSIGANSLSSLSLQNSLWLSMNSGWEKGAREGIEDIWHELVFGKIMRCDGILSLRPFYIIILDSNSRAKEITLMTERGLCTHISDFNSFFRPSINAPRRAFSGHLSCKL